MAVNVSQWSNVAVAVQSALATAVTLSGITKANPGVASWASGTDPSNGDYMRLTVSGMHQVDGRVFRAANVSGAGNTVELEGEDTSAYDTFSSGTLEVITFGTTLSTLVSINATGGDFEFADVTTIHDTTRKQVPTVASPSTFTFESIWDTADAGLVALKAASDSKATRAIRFTFANGQKFLFVGYVGCTLAPTGSAQDVVKTSVVFTAFGRPTVYSS